MAKREPAPLRELLPRTLVRVAQATQSAATLGPLWSAAAGPVIAARAIPSTLEDGTLTLQVSSPAWAQELSRRHDELLGRLNGELGSVLVRKLVFRPGKQA